MFTGTYEHTIDAKGRTSIPQKFRETLQREFDERLMLTKFDGCLYAYPMDTWKRLEMKIAAQPAFDRQVRAFQRTLIGGAMECPIDGQGRILVPSPLRSYAGLKKDIVFIGMLHQLEIWDAQRWNEISVEAEKVAQSSDWLSTLKL